MASHDAKRLCSIGRLSTSDQSPPRLLVIARQSAAKRGELGGIMAGNRRRPGTRSTRSWKLDCAQSYETDVRGDDSVLQAAWKFLVDGLAWSGSTLFASSQSFDHQTEYAPSPERPSRRAPSVPIRSWRWLTRELQIHLNISTLRRLDGATLRDVGIECVDQIPQHVRRLSAGYTDLTHELTNPRPHRHSAPTSPAQPDAANRSARSLAETKCVESQ